jgi:hypothetical protein
MYLASTAVEHKILNLVGKKVAQTMVLQTNNKKNHS